MYVGALALIKKLNREYWYPFVTRRIDADDVVFLNFGYEEDPPMGLPLAASDEPNRFCIQLLVTRYRTCLCLVSDYRAGVTEVGRGGAGERNRNHALAPLRQRHGGLPVQKLTKAHLDELVADLAAGRCPGQRHKWGANSINPMLNIISAVLAGLVKQGLLVRDIAALVDRLPRPKTRMKTLTEAEVKALLKHVEADRLAHAWHLALSGLRRGELCGPRWSDVDLKGGTLTVAHNRVSVNGRPLDLDDPKTNQSARTLPLTLALTAALRRAQTTQKAERLPLGLGYGPGEHVVCDQAGRPYHPDTISDYWSAMCVAAKVAKIRLHDARHTCGTLVHLQGVPIVVVSAWLGHADPAFTMRTYVHSQNEALKAAAASLQAVVSPLCQ
jgi:integrase